MNHNDRSTTSGLSGASKRTLLTPILIAGVLVSLGVLTPGMASGAPVAEEIINASDMQAADVFGASVEISGDYAVVGAPWENGGAGDPAINAGAAYIFERTGTDTWTEKAILHSSDMQAYDEFGDDVAISGGYAIVGAPLEDGGPGDPVDRAGAAYIFRRNSSGNWVQQARLQASTLRAYDYFGDDVSISGRYAAVGTLGSGVYVFRRSSSSGQWSLQAHVTYSRDQYFGVKVAIDDRNLMVGGDGSVTFYRRSSSGAWKRNSRLQIGSIQFYPSSIAIDGSVAVAGDNWIDQAWVLEENSSGHWFITDELYGQQGTDFAFSVATNGTNVMIGASGEGYAGEAYVYRKSGSSWIKSLTLSTDNIAEGAQFGTSVDMNGAGLMMVGAWLDTVGYPECGSTYIYRLID